jgi:hypothetical protein
MIKTKAKTVIPLGCPFCGEIPLIEPWHGGGPKKRMVNCINETCHVQPAVSGSTRLHAIRKWNYRVRID